MFIGEYQNKIDDKGRLAVPVKFRAYLSDGAVVTRGLDGSLSLYPKAEWAKIAEKLSNLPISQKEARSFVRLMLAGAMEVELDKQGRMVLPQYLRAYAGIKSNVLVAGLFNRVEIWSQDRWSEESKDYMERSDSWAEVLGSLGV